MIIVFVPDVIRILFRTRKDVTIRGRAQFHGTAQQTSETEFAQNSDHARSRKGWHVWVVKHAEGKLTFVLL